MLAGGSTTGATGAARPFVFVHEIADPSILIAGAGDAADAPDAAVAATAAAAAVVAATMQVCAETSGHRSPWWTFPEWWHH